MRRSASCERGHVFLGAIDAHVASWPVRHLARPRSAQLDRNTVRLRRSAPTDANEAVRHRPIPISTEILSSVDTRKSTSLSTRERTVYFREWTEAVYTLAIGLAIVAGLTGYKYVRV
jgi:hypothetical protein